MTEGSGVMEGSGAEAANDEIIQYRELAAVLALVISVAAGAVALYAELVALAVPLAGLGIGLGFWAAARGERAVVATLAIALGAAAAVIAALGS